MDCEVYASIANNIWHVVIARPGYPAVVMLSGEARKKAVEAEERGNGQLASRLRVAAGRADSNNRRSATGPLTVNRFPPTVRGGCRDWPVTKAERERRIFLEFVEASGLPINPATIENRPPPEPDIRCVVAEKGSVAFELVELCNAELAKDIGDQIKRGTDPTFLMLDDPGPIILRDKLQKRYCTDAPIELLCYSGRIAVSDDRSFASLLDVTDLEGMGPFRRVWFLGEETCEILGRSRQLAFDEK